MPGLLFENRAAYDVYCRTFGAFENIDPFRVMELVGIKEDEKLYCFDLISKARSEVLKARQAKKG